MNTLSNNNMTTILESPAGLRTAIHEFSQDKSHENWLKLSKVFHDKFDEKQSIRYELLRGIIGHILSSK